MYYEVEICHVNHNISDLKDKFYCVIIDDMKDLLILFKDISEEDSPIQHDKTMRYAIPLSYIEKLTIKPIYEDNGQKISSC